MAGNLNLGSVLSSRNLLGLIETVKPGLPDDVLPPGLNNPGPRRCEGDSGTYYRVQGTRRTAQLVMYGSPSKRRTLSGVQEIPIKLSHFKENVEIKAQTLINIEDPDGNKQRLGEWEVARQMKEIKQIMVNTRLAQVMSVMALGAVYYDASGNLLPTSAGAQITIDYAVPSGNKSTLNIDGSGAVIGTLWSNSAAPISQQCALIKQKARKLNGYVPKVALYGSNIMNYILNNAQLKELISRNPAWQQSFANGEIPDNFLGFDWYPAYQCFFEDQNGTAQEIFGANNVTFVPDPRDGTWYELLEGTNPIPKNLNLTGDLETAMQNISLAQGQFAYAKVTDDPVGGTIIYGDTFLYTLNVPAAVYIATVG